MLHTLGPVKAKDTATSLGPWLITPDELEPRRSGKSFDLEMSASVNGRPYSMGNADDLYWSFGQMISYASRGTRVQTGDVIASGTVGTGCILELSTCTARTSTRGWSRATRCGWRPTCSARSLPGSPHRRRCIP